jgi:hypothetical protein
MNTIIKNTITIFAIAMTLLACSKSNDNPADSSGNGTFTCKIDGVPFTATSATGGDNSKIVAPGITLATFINARAADGSTMIFSIDQTDCKVGTLNLDGTDGSIVNYGKDTNYSWPSGSINITAFTETRAKGSFNFTLKVNRDGVSPQIVVTEGVFDVPLQNGL